MKLTVVAVGVLAAAALTFSPARADADGHVNFFLGQKSLSSDDWKPLEKQIEFGAVMSFGQDDWPVHIAVDVLTSVDQETVYDPFTGDVTLTGSTFEIDAGVRKIWKAGKVFPYFGGGSASSARRRKSTTASSAWTPPTQRSVFGPMPECSSGWEATSISASTCATAPPTWISTSVPDSSRRM